MWAGCSSACLAWSDQMPRCPLDRSALTRMSTTNLRQCQWGTYSQRDMPLRSLCDAPQCARIAQQGRGQVLRCPRSVQYSGSMCREGTVYSGSLVQPHTD